MPISHEHKCIFFHIPKCAGSGMESRLGLGDIPTTNLDVLWGRHSYDLFKTLGPTTEVDGKTVLLYVELQHLTPEQMLHAQYVSKDVFDNYFRFAFIRNPWDRLVSEYFWRPRSPDFKTFLNWVANLDQETELNQYPHFIPQHRFVYSREGRSMMNFVGRYENLFEDWEYVREKLKLKAKGLPHLLKSKHKPYTEYYDQSSVDLVAKIYKKDINLFGYKFGED